MAEYTITLNTPIMGMDIIAIDNSEDYKIGQEISLTLDTSLTVAGLSGSVTLETGEVIAGTVSGKE